MKRILLTLLLTPLFLLNAYADENYTITLTNPHPLGSTMYYIKQIGGYVGATCEATADQKVLPAEGRIVANCAVSQPGRIAVITRAIADPKTGEPQPGTEQDYCLITFGDPEQFPGDIKTATFDISKVVSWWGAPCVLAAGE
jgi:hypothetical protein